MPYRRLASALLLASSVFALGLEFPTADAQTTTAPLRLTDPCAANDYFKEFRRQDQKPYGKPLPEWTDADFRHLRSMMEACLDPWIASAPDRKRIHFENVDKQLASIQQAQQQKLAQAANAARIQEAKVAEAEAREKALERNRAESLKLVRIGEERLAWLEEFGRKFDALPLTTAGAKSLEDAEAGLSQIMDPRTSDPSLEAAAFPAPLQETLRAAQRKLQQKIAQRRDAISAGIRSAARDDKRRQAAVLADANRATIEKLGFPTKYLDATLFTHDLPPNNKIMPLRHFLASLLERKEVTVTGVRLDNDAYGISIKKPGEPADIYALMLEANDLFVVGFQRGDRYFNLDFNPIDRSFAESQLLRFVEW